MKYCVSWAAITEDPFDGQRGVGVRIKVDSELAADGDKLGVSIGSATVSQRTPTYICA